MNKNKYINVIVAVVITFVLLGCGGVFAIIWSITDYSTGILLRVEPKKVSSYTEYENYDNCILDIDTIIPSVINVKELEYETDENMESLIVTFEILNKSEYDDVDYDVYLSYDEDYEYFMSKVGHKNIELDSGEIIEVQYKISRYKDSREAESFKNKGSIGIDAYISCYTDDDYSYSHVSTEGGEIYWDSNYDLQKITCMNIYNYN